MIQHGYVYVAQPPLYRIQSGKIKKYVYSDEEKDEFLAKLNKSHVSVNKKIDQKGFTIKKIGESKDEIKQENSEESVKTPKINIQRYKGLGEMNPDELFNTTMDPKNRVLKRIEIGDISAADEIFDILMGKDVAPRKKFIETHARGVKNLDV